MWTGILATILLVASLLVWADSQHRYGKASIAMAGLLPVTLGLTGFAYLIYRSKHQPGPEFPYPQKNDWRTWVSLLLFVNASGLVLLSDELPLPQLLEKVTGQGLPRAQVK